MPATEVDHIVNVEAGGTDDDSNLEAICSPCHKAKTAREAHAGRG
ncbi:HNH endonuclease [Salinicola halophyticus]|nr:HNH endonuclease signature motif containing protein [Salinicola halophyticus]